MWGCHGICAPSLRRLTDDVSRDNWIKYGNPDGPQAATFGIALPAWVVEKQNSFWVSAVWWCCVLISLPPLYPAGPRSVYLSVHYHPTHCCGKWQSQRLTPAAKPLPLPLRGRGGTGLSSTLQPTCSFRLRKSSFTSSQNTNS